MTDRRATALRGRLLGIAVVALLLLPGPALAKTVGFSVGDSMVFSYERLSTYATPNGNVTSVSMNQFTVVITSINASAPHGEVGYTETIQEFNNTVQTTSSLYQNFTTVFDPYDNDTYLGNIGFYPFTYADLPDGSANNLGINVTLTDVPIGNGSVVSSVQRINATVARSAGSIDVNLTTIGYTGEEPSHWDMRFNSTTGILEYGRTTVNVISDIEGIYTYNLVSYTHHSSQNLSFLPYLAIAVVVVIAVVLVAQAVVGRKSPREKKEERMRKRLAG